MPALRKTLTSALAAVLLTAGLTLGTAAPASAASCPSSASPTIPGARAHWVLACSGNTLKVYGWVEDTRVDGRDAIVEIWPEGHHWRLVDARGMGTRTNFDFEFPGTKKASVTLRLTK
ncbi:hypothetical protein ACPMJQ_29585 [Streptomyces pseudogriseolus]|uniref:hypothetical protein n=1 Tax=Streptomyces TaxID=1883 RepID=UPI002257670B|nr:hypothetical protein [Streptomyces viridodiastaticus]MCX4618038.1 hypothetical protein [Streptomyces viridodiastaticus]